MQRTDARIAAPYKCTTAQVEEAIHQRPGDPCAASSMHFRLVRTCNSKERPGRREKRRGNCCLHGRTRGTVTISNDSWPTMALDRDALCFSSYSRWYGYLNFSCLCPTLPVYSMPERTTLPSPSSLMPNHHGPHRLRPLRLFDLPPPCWAPVVFALLRESVLLSTISKSSPAESVVGVC